MNGSANANEMQRLSSIRSDLARLASTHELRHSPLLPHLSCLILSCLRLGTSDAFIRSSLITRLKCGDSILTLTSMLFCLLRKCQSSSNQGSHAMPCPLPLPSYSLSSPLQVISSTPLLSSFTSLLYPTQAMLAIKSPLARSMCSIQGERKEPSSPLPTPRFYSPSHCASASCGMPPSPAAFHAL